VRRSKFKAKFLEAKAEGFLRKILAEKISREVHKKIFGKGSEKKF